jgi:phospholipid/cholesterol/gamma-HCH transport system ATP-binding protein
VDSNPRANPVSPAALAINSNQPQSDSLVRIRDLHFRRGQRAIFDGIDLDIPRGRITAILGPSGTGKTTLLRLIGAQLAPLRGTVEVDGQDVNRLPPKPLYALRKRIGMLFQSGALLTDLTLYENVAFPLREHTRLPESMLRSLVLMKLDMVGLRAARDLYPRELSGGMARRAALARAIALDPMMIMYDEPFSGQDPISMGVLVRLIKRLNETLGITSVLVSHDVAETCSIADYVYVLSGAKIVGHGTPREMLDAQSPTVRQFMGGLPDGPVPFHFPGRPYLEDLLEDTPR